MFCIVCGSEAFHDNRCESCYLVGKKLFDYRAPQLNFCDECGRYHTGRDIMTLPQLEEFLRHRIRAIHRITTSDITFKQQHHQLTALITVHGTIPPSKKLLSDRLSVVIRPRHMKCPICVRILGRYHEALIQIRGPDKEVIFKKISRMLKRDNIAAIDHVKEGYDVRIVTKGVARSVVQSLSDRFQITSSFKLAGEKKGKKLYRSVYAIR